MGTFWRIKMPINPSWSIYQEIYSVNSKDLKDIFLRFWIYFYRAVLFKSICAKNEFENRVKDRITERHVIPKLNQRKFSFLIKGKAVNWRRVKRDDDFLQLSIQDQNELMKIDTNSITFVLFDEILRNSNTKSQAVLNQITNFTKFQS